MNFTRLPRRPSCCNLILRHSHIMLCWKMWKNWEEPGCVAILREEEYFNDYIVFVPKSQPSTWFRTTTISATQDYQLIFHVHAFFNFVDRFMMQRKANSCKLWKATGIMSTASRTAEMVRLPHSIDSLAMFPLTLHHTHIHCEDWFPPATTCELALSVPFHFPQQSECACMYM